MLTDEQVEKFIEERLGIWNWSAQLSESKLGFLKELYKRFRQVMYFENVTWGAKPEDELTTPTIQDVIHQVMETPGGVCIHLNYFMNMLLVHLGYEVHPAAAASVTMTLPKNHIILIVHVPADEDEEEGSKNMYMVDVGFPWPITEPMSLKHLPNITRAGGFQLIYRYNEEREGYERALVGGDPINREFDDEDEERVDVLFDTEPLSFDDFNETMTSIFTDSSCSFFLNTTLLFRFIRLEDKDNFEYVCCLGRKIIIGTPQRRTIHTFHDYLEMVPEIMKYFPQLDEEVVSKACDNYQRRQDAAKQ